MGRVLDPVEDRLLTLLRGERLEGQEGEPPPRRPGWLEARVGRHEDHDGHEVELLHELAEAREGGLVGPLEVVPGDDGRVLETSRPASTPDHRMADEPCRP